MANLAWTASSVPSWRKFARALHDPNDAQMRLLRGCIARSAGTLYARAHGIDVTRTYGEFTRQVPIVQYETIEPWIVRIANGEENVLTRERVTHLVPTSGSTAGRKLIPFTAGLQREFNRAIAPWIVDLFVQFPSLAAGSAYWSISPVSQILQKASVVPTGFEDDIDYLGGPRKRLVDAVMAVPSAVRHVRDLDAFRYVTLLCLLRRQDLSLISVWHPSFLALLLDALPANWERLLADVQSGGCSMPESPELRRVFGRAGDPKRARSLQRANPEEPLTIWPSLKVISCWADAHAEFSARALQRRLPGVVLQPKGLLATEAFVSLPFRGKHPIAVRSHFFEFMDDHGRVHLVDALREGHEYEVIVSTAGGLWRYRLGDGVRVDGFLGRTPSIRFVGRNGNVSDRRGEKLSEMFVSQAIRKASAVLLRLPEFALLAPEENGACGYTLFVEGEVNLEFARRLENLLRENPHYAICRDLGQLRPVRIFKIRHRGYEAFVSREVADGKRLGEIKSSSLSQRSGWADVFDGAYFCDTPLVWATGP